MLQTERRRFHRINLEHPIRAFAGAVPVQLVDASIAGVRLISEAPLPAVGATCRVMFQSEFGPVSVDCEVVYSSGQPKSYRTGLRVLAADRQSQERLREMVAVASASSKRRDNGDP